MWDLLAMGTRALASRTASATAPGSATSASNPAGPANNPATPPGFSNPLETVPENLPQGQMMQMVQAIAAMLAMLLERLQAMLGIGEGAANGQPPAQLAGNGGGPAGAGDSHQGHNHGHSHGSGSGRSCNSGGCNGSTCSHNHGSSRAGAGRQNIPVVNANRLNDSLAAISQDPEGGRLLAEARRRGVQFRVGATSRDNWAGEFNPNNNTITVRDGADVRVLVHELVHATTTEDGNSLHEEATAFIVGERVAARLNGTQSRDRDTIYRETMGLYRGARLARTNGVENSLSRIGVTA
jgi:hypothetical protein